MQPEYDQACGGHLVNATVCMLLQMTRLGQQCHVAATCTLIVVKRVAEICCAVTLAASHAMEDQRALHARSHARPSAIMADAGRAAQNPASPVLSPVHGIAHIRYSDY